MEFGILIPGIPLPESLTRNSALVSPTSFISGSKLLSFYYFLKVDREDHFQHPGFLHVIICVFPGYNASNLVKNWMLPMFKKPQNLKGLIVNLVLGLFKQCSHVQIFFCFFIERILMDSSYILWSKFQDCQLGFILTNGFLVTACRLA